MKEPYPRVLWNVEDYGKIFTEEIPDFLYPYIVETIESNLESSERNSKSLNEVGKRLITLLENFGNWNKVNHLIIAEKDNDILAMGDFIEKDNIGILYHALRFDYNPKLNGIGNLLVSEAERYCFEFLDLDEINSSFETDGGKRILEKRNYRKTDKILKLETYRGPCYVKTREEYKNRFNVV